VGICKPQRQKLGKAIRILSCDFSSSYLPIVITKGLKIARKKISEAVCASQNVA